MTDEPTLLEAARLLTFRLARLSVDSTWARRSSGLAKQKTGGMRT